MTKKSSKQSNQLLPGQTSPPSLRKKSSVQDIDELRMQSPDGLEGINPKQINRKSASEVKGGQLQRKSGGGSEGGQLQRKSGDKGPQQLQRKSGGGSEGGQLQRKSGGPEAHKAVLTPWIDDDNVELSGLEKDLARLEGPKKLTRKSANDVPHPPQPRDTRRSTFPEDDFERKRGVSNPPVPALPRESIDRKRGVSQPPDLIEPVRHLDLNWRSGAGKREEATILKYFPVVPIVLPKPPGQA